MRLDNDVLNVLAAAETDGDKLRLTGQLDRALYVKTNKALDAAGGKWNRSAKAHIFPGDAAEAIDQMMLTGEIIAAKQEFGYFPTPPAIVQRLIDLAKLAPGMLALEPSAGRGAIAKALVTAGCRVDSVELLPENVAALREDFPDAREHDFLTYEPTPVYDRVVMNPPFARQADIHHVTHAAQFLKDDGLLVSVMSNGVTFRENKLTADFRERVHYSGGWFEDLPDGAFKDSGTMVRTVIAVVPAS